MAIKRKLPTVESKAIGQRIATARTKAEHTQETLAMALGVSGALVAQYETGKTGITAKRADQLTRALGVSMSWLLTGDEPETVTRAQTEPEKEALVILRSIRAEDQAALLDALKAVAKALAR